MHLPVILPSKMETYFRLQYLAKNCWKPILLNIDLTQLRKSLKKGKKEKKTKHTHTHTLTQSEASISAYLLSNVRTTSKCPSLAAEISTVSPSWNSKGDKSGKHKSITPAFHLRQERQPCSQFHFTKFRFCQNWPSHTKPFFCLKRKCSNAVKAKTKLVACTKVKTNRP